MTNITLCKEQTDFENSIFIKEIKNGCLCIVEIFSDFFVYVLYGFKNTHE